jgi:hypothetical protein
VHRGSVDAVRESLSTEWSGEFRHLRAPVVERLVAEPTRYTDLIAVGDSDARRVAMASAFRNTATGERFAAIGLGTVEALGPRGKGFVDLALEVHELPDGDLFDLAVVLLAQRLESIVGSALEPIRTFDWNRERPERGLWAGLPPAVDDRQAVFAVEVLGRVAGVELVCVEPDLSSANQAESLTPFGREVDLVLLCRHFASKGQVRLAAEAAERGLPVIEVGGDGLDDALESARPALHQLVRSAIAASAARAGEEVEPEVATPEVTLRHRIAVHAVDRFRQYGYSVAEIEEALGDASRPAATASEADADVEPGCPIRIGTQPREPGRPDRREVLLGRTCEGRWVILVLAREKSPPEVVTVWDPDAPENAGKWRPDRLGPTRAGSYTLPFTIWVFDPQ